MIKVEKITKRYNDLVVFENYTTTFKKGEITAIIGKSGRGKTTLLRLLMGLETVDSGRITGIDSKKISVMFQEDRLIEKLSIYQNICLPHMNKGQLPSMEHIEKIIKLLDIEADIKKKTEELSGGMKRRVAIARAMLAKFDTLILDEPFKGLDEKTKLITMDFVKKYSKGKTVILVTHDKDEIDYLNCNVIKL